VTLWVLTLLITSSMFMGLDINVFASPQTTVYIDPPYLWVLPCNDFTVDVNVEDVVDLYAWQINLTFDPSLMTCISVTEGPFLRMVGPTIWPPPIINNTAGWIMAACARMMPPGAYGSGTLAYITFHCERVGRSSLHFKSLETFLLNSYLEPIPFDAVDGTVEQTTVYWKQGYKDYAPSGVPDFDQRQDNWGKIDPGSGMWKWTWCGPTAVANSLWWMDSRFEPGTTPPPTMSDGFPLVQWYGMWDDHDPQNVQPFITDLGWYMDTDGIRTGYPWVGTDVHQVVKGISMYLRDRGLETEFVIKKMKKPDFFYVEYEIERCEDVILLLGIWQTYDGITWWRVGGHYVTCAGVDSSNLMIAFSDPDANSAEAGGMGRVLPPGVPHPHPPRPVAPPQQDTLHNDAAFVSHDLFYVNLASPSPGGTFAIAFYEPIYNRDFMQNIQGQNCPSEFKPQEGPYDPAAYTAVEVEYSIIVSPADWYFKPPQEDYAPSGVPDFDQKQWLTPEYNWTNPYPPVNTWSHCGPVAVANSLWWLDSAFELNPIPPPTINDGFPLVQSYGQWDDHAPQNVPYLVENLAWFMDTNGMRTQPPIPHCGTEVHDMEYGIDWYLSWKGLDWKFYEHTQPYPDFYWIEDEIKRCEDVILLLGFWQNYGTEIEPYWVRLGGHYVTCAGVDSTNMMLALSDPFIDNAEWGFPGRVIPPVHPHTGPPETLHNNATYVSHDFYLVGRSPSPGGYWGLYQYPAEDIIDNFGSCQNTPEEFIKYDGEYIPGLPIYTEIEYAVIISCKTGKVAAGSEDGNVYVHDFNGNLLWYSWVEAYCVSVAFDNEARYLAAGWRISDYGYLAFFDANAVTDGGPNTPLWYDYLAISESYHHLYGGYESSGHESMSVDVKYNFYNQCYIVAAAHDYGLNLYDEWGNLIWQYFDEEGAETIVRISQDGNYILCADDYATGTLHYFSHLRDGVPGWGPNDGIPIWSFGSWYSDYGVLWTAISGVGDYVAVGAFDMQWGRDAVILLNRTGNIVWQHIGVGGMGSHLTKVDMPCHGRSVVAATEDLSNSSGCDLYYFDDGGDGWDSGDGTPVWTYWPGQEIGNPHDPSDDFYTVAISGNGDVISAGGWDGWSYLYVLDKSGTVLDIEGDGTTIHSVDVTLNGRYTALGTGEGYIALYDKDISGWTWVQRYTGYPIRSVAISKIYPCMFPYPNHDVAVTNVRPYKTLIGGGGYGMNITVTVANQGDFTETFDVAIYANATFIQATRITLTSGNSAAINLKFNTTGFVKGNYTISAVASIVPDEIDIYDNTLADVTIRVRVGVPCDVTGSVSIGVPDDVCNMRDIGYICAHFMTTPLSTNWDPNCDVTGPNAREPDGVVNMRDIGEACANFLNTDP